MRKLITAVAAGVLVVALGAPAFADSARSPSDRHFTAMRADGRHGGDRDWGRHGGDYRHHYGHDGYYRHHYGSYGYPYYYDGYYDDYYARCRDAYYYDRCYFHHSGGGRHYHRRSYRP